VAATMGGYAHGRAGRQLRPKRRRKSPTKWWARGRSPVFVRGTLADLLAGWDMPLFVTTSRPAEYTRVLLFDKRGSGLSDYRSPSADARDNGRPPRGHGRSRLRSNVLWAAQEGTGSRSCSRPRTRSGRAPSSSTTRLRAASGRRTIPGLRPTRSGAASCARSATGGATAATSSSAHIG
jgi:hypothetical protein